MNTHIIPARNKQHFARVRYNPKLRSFTAEVLDRARDAAAQAATERLEETTRGYRLYDPLDVRAASDDAVIFRVGTEGEILSVTELVSALDEWVELSAEIREQLESDRRADVEAASGHRALEELIGIIPTCTEKGVCFSTGGNDLLS